MAFGSAIHKRSSYTHTNLFSDASERELPGCVCGRRDVPQMGRSNEQHSRKSRGTSSPFLQLLRPEDTTGVLEGFHAQCSVPPGGGERARSTRWGHTEDPRWVHRSRYIPDRGRVPNPSKKDVYKDCRASCECFALILHGFVVGVFVTEQIEES